MTYDRLAAIRSESDAFLAALDLGQQPQVPGCPDWTVGDLAYHLGSVHRNHAAHVVRGVTTEPDFPALPDPSDDELPGWFADGVQVLLSALRETPADLPAWNWAPHTAQVASWWSRRMAVETAVHRWDAESAHGVAHPVPLAIALDGIDEMLTVVGPAHTKPDWPSGTVEVRTPERRWAVRMAPDLFEPAGPGTPDAVLEGTASDVLLAMWGRAVPYEATGDRALVRVLT